MYLPKVTKRDSPAAAQFIYLYILYVYISYISYISKGVLRKPHSLPFSQHMAHELLCSTEGKTAFASAKADGNPEGPGFNGEIDCTILV